MIQVEAPTAPTSTRIPMGHWIMASTVLDRLVGRSELYPCLCTPPCRTKGEKTCPCIGRPDLHPALPEHCCAVLAARSTGWRERAQALSVTLVPIPRRWAAPAYPWSAPAAYVGDARPAAPRWTAPINPEVEHHWAIPIRVLEPWQRQSRHPWTGEADCHTCGELLAEHLVKQGYVNHVGC